MQKNESDGPPLKDLVREVETDDKRPSFHFHLDGQSYYLKNPRVAVTWRHKLYWGLRSLIDWIHP